jgi:hypothetical protein
MADFPLLTGVAKTGKKQLWSVQVKETKEGYGEIVVRHGYEGGAVTTDGKVVTEGKNLGKKNETTPIQQAVLEARSLWNKKKASGYVEEAGKPDGGAGKGSGSGVALATPTAASAASAAASLVSSRATKITESVPLPMLAHKWPEKKKHITFPCYVQPKFDGTRTLALCGKKAGYPCLFSRQRKAYPQLEHIAAICHRLPRGLILDGELYRHDMDFQSIVGTVKKKTLTKANEAKQALIRLREQIDTLIQKVPYLIDKQVENYIIDYVESRFTDVITPRMTNDQRIAITSPAIGLMVYCTDAVEGVYVNKSTGWTFIG